MHDPVAKKLRVFQGRDHGEHPPLLRPFQVCLEAHQVVDAALGVVLAQLHHRVRRLARFGIPEALGLQGPVAQGVLPPPGHDLHWHTALEDPGVLKAVDFRLLGRAQLLPEGQILLLGEGAVYIIRIPFVVTGGEPSLVHVDALKAYQGRGCVVKAEGGAVREPGPDGRDQAVGGQRPGGHDNGAVGKGGHLPLHHSDEGVASYCFGDGGGEAMAVYRQSASRLHPVGVGAGENDALKPPQLLLEKAHGVFQLVGAQRVGAHQLGKIRALVGRGGLFRLHLPQCHRDASLCQLPGRFAPGKARADDGDRLHSRIPLSLPLWRAYFFAVFLAAVFFAVVFLAAVFFAAVFFVAVFLAAVFSPSSFFL